MRRAIDLYRYRLACARDAQRFDERPFADVGLSLADDTQGWRRRQRGERRDLEGCDTGRRPPGAGVDARPAANWIDACARIVRGMLSELVLGLYDGMPPTHHLTDAARMATGLLRAGRRAGRCIAAPGRASTIAEYGSAIAEHDWIRLGLLQAPPATGSPLQRCRSLLRDVVTVAASTGTGTLWRGQASIDWRLVPSIARRKLPAENRSQAVLDWTSKTLAEAEAAAGRWRDGIHYRGLHPIEKLAHLRHHGVPSPLIDVTPDPFVALCSPAIRDQTSQGSSSASIPTASRSVSCVPWSTAICAGGSWRDVRHATNRSLAWVGRCAAPSKRAAYTRWIHLFSMTGSSYSARGSCCHGFRRRTHGTTALQTSGYPAFPQAGLRRSWPLHLSSADEDGLLVSRSLR